MKRTLIAIFFLFEILIEPDVIMFINYDIPPLVTVYSTTINSFDKYIDYVYLDGNLPPCYTNTKQRRNEMK